MRPVHAGTGHFKRGERVEELAAAAKLHFPGVCTYMPAQDISVRKWMSRHALVEDGDLRESQKLDLVASAVATFWTVTEVDMIPVMVAKDPRNVRRALAITQSR
jgi:hypothetical protein